MTMLNKSRWYVYELVDSRTNEVFYVGKGCGDRMYQHEREALKGVCSKKTFKINEIRNSGAEIVKRQVAFFWDEQAAYDCETDWIEEIGLANLTNVLPGGQTAWARRVVERKARAEKLINPVDAVLKVIGNVAWWLVNTNGGKNKLRMVNAHPVREKLFDTMCNTFMPEFVQRAVQTPEGRAKVSEALKKFNVDLTFAGVEHGCA